MSVEKQIEAVQAEDWFGCYDGQRGDLFTRESNRHPAKMAIGLCFRIFDHGEKMGYWKKGDLILDPMAGIGTTLICGAVLGYRMLGVELESHFIELAWGNIQRCAERVPDAGTRFVRVEGFYADRHALRYPPFGIIQGDARHLAEFVQGGAAEASLRRPIFEGKSGGGINVKGYGPDGADKVGDRTYSARTVSGAATSPPYPSEFREEHPGTQGGKVAEEFERGGSFRGYSGAVSSPPYAGKDDHGPDPHPERMEGTGNQFRGYPEQAGAQIGNLRDPKNDIDAVLSSPPFEDREAQKATRKFRDPEGFAEEQARRYQSGEMKGHPASAQAILKNMEEQSTVELSADSISRKNGETYLSAMLEVYRQLHIVLKPGGVVALVTKNPVKNKAIRRLDLDTIRLMEASGGFVLLERKRAMLAETVTHGDLFAGETTRKHERKSFFKRLFEKKNPHLAVDYEDVLFFRSI